MAKNQPSKDERKRRLNVVEKTMAEVGWSGRIVRALADQFDVTERTVCNYRREVMDEIALAYRGPDIEATRAEFLSRIRSHQATALREGALGPLCSLMNIEARVTGLEQAQAGDKGVQIVIQQGVVKT
jgi:hypothetical protein